MATRLRCGNAIENSEVALLSNTEKRQFPDIEPSPATGSTSSSSSRSSSNSSESSTFLHSERE
uniref:Uncharacterized protein n=1 Tax=Anopheles minimus TaxID=112268 RepID=A0A182WGT3_9DIPT